MSLDTAIQPPTADRPLADLTAALSLEEKVRLVVGAGLWSTTAIPRIGLRAMHVSDGPAGVRGVSDSADETSASFPAPSALAATWDVDLADEVGTLFAAEARPDDQTHLLLGRELPEQPVEVGVGPGGRGGVGRHGMSLRPDVVVAVEAQSSTTY